MYGWRLNNMQITCHYIIIITAGWQIFGVYKHRRHIILYNHIVLHVLYTPILLHIMLYYIIIPIDGVTTRVKYSCILVYTIYLTSNCICYIITIGECGLQLSTEGFVFFSKSAAVQPTSVQGIRSDTKRIRHENVQLRCSD